MALGIKTKVFQVVTMYDWVSPYCLSYFTLPHVFLALATLVSSRFQGAPCSFFPRAFTQALSSACIASLSPTHPPPPPTLFPPLGAPPEVISSRNNSLAQRPNQISFTFPFTAQIIITETKYFLNPDSNRR